MAAVKVNLAPSRSSSSRRFGPASVSMWKVAAPCAAIHAARHRRPFPEISERLPSALSRRIDARDHVSGAREKTRSPSAPMPRCRSHTARAREASSACKGSSRSSSSRKSLPKAWDLMRCMLTHGQQNAEAYGTLKPRNTQVRPAVKPKVGSRAVIPMTTPPSRRTVACVSRAPRRMAARLSPPGGVAMSSVGA